MEPLPVIGALAGIVRTLPGARLRVDAHTDVVSSGYERFDPEVAAALRGLEREGALEMVVHDFFSDDELWDYLQCLDLSVLPYRFGTHSGWLEACYDLGTPVLVSDCGYYADQRPCLTYRTTTEGPDIESLGAAVRRAHTERPCWRASPIRRRQEREAIATAHRRIYEGVLG
jgi:glycosyltransferase involved in cell wall biosynthesis